MKKEAPMARTNAATIGRTTSLARRITHMKRSGNHLGLGAWRLQLELEIPEQGRQAVAVLDLALPDERRQLRDRNPFDAVGLARVRWFANVFRAGGQEYLSLIHI